MNEKPINSFSGKEKELYIKVKELKQVYFKPFLRFFTFVGLSPNALSFIGFLSALLFPIFAFANSVIAFFGLLGQAIFDLFDGALADYQKKASKKGSYVDLFFDNLTLVIVGLSFLVYGVVEPFWVALYLVNYLVIVFLTLTLNSKNIKYFFIFRGKYFWFLFFFIDVWMGTPILPYFTSISAVYMTLMCLYLFNKLRCSTS